MSIPEFLKIKKIKIPCDECKKGILKHQISSIYSKIDRSVEELKMENQEEVRKIVQKIKAGDERVIRDIYGDKPNTLKEQTEK
jgi:hypothetical protein